MSTARAGTPAGRFAQRYAVSEDSALEALLAIERAWKRAHADGEPVPDEWGEGRSGLRLADLGLDTRLRTEAMVGYCPRHGEFVSEWTAMLAERVPEHLRCTAVGEGQRCQLQGPVLGIGRGIGAAGSDPER